MTAGHEAMGAEFIKALVGAWDCCGTCAGGVLAKHDREVAVQASRAALGDVLRQIEKARNEHWQQHLREHPRADAREKSCPRDYGIHDAFAHAANIVRGMSSRPGESS